MAHIAEDVCTAILGKYQKYEFRLYEENDHILVLEHVHCGFKDRFNTTSVTIAAILNDCENHIKQCPKYRLIHIVDESRKRLGDKL